MFGRWKRREQAPVEPELFATGAIAFLLPNDPVDPGEDPDPIEPWEEGLWNAGLEDEFEDWVPEEIRTGWTVVYLADDVPQNPR